MTHRKPDALLLRVMAAIHKTAEKPPKGFRTMDQWAKVWKCERTTARQYIIKGMQLGLIEEKTYRVNIRRDAKPYPVAHYGEMTRPRKT